MVLLPFIVVEEKSRLSRAIAALLLAAVISGGGCSLNRGGLAIDGNLPADAHADLPADTAHPTGGAAAGGAPGTGGVGGAGGSVGGATGTGGAGGGAGGTAGAAPDANAGDTGLVEAGTDGSGVDGPVDMAGDRAGADVPPDVATCGASALCDNAVVVTLPGGRFTGTTSGVSVDQGSCGGDRAPEAVFRLVLTERSDVFVTTHGTGFDTVVYMRNGCCGAEVACNDNMDNRTTSVLSAQDVAPGTYDIFVDGHSNQNQSGAFTVDIYATQASAPPGDNCGNPVRIANQAMTGTTCGMDNDFAPTAGCLVAPMTTSFDTVYYFVLDQMTNVMFNTCVNTCIDTVLSIRDVCTNAMPANQRACNDNFCAPTAGVCPMGSLPTQSQVRGMMLSAGVHYLIVDSHVINTATGCGNYTITPTGVPQ